ncbi:hypothetical protein LAZ67_11003131 [Cordylochernes scorpioides]|uniref:Uncharacterized protein n=1 Tax=Cordylochernes scorpioides TaxID=51811 RepID=A0ABY6L2D1_9ARAC|nr:hypothetical protein LAZ67_11003131 [Cordylochernes scorpioides]
MEAKICFFKTINNGSLEQVKALIEKGADVNARFDEDLMANYRKIVLGEFDMPFPARPRGYIILNDTPLHFAINLGKEDVYKLLVDNGADINARNTLECTPLHQSIEFPHFKIFKDLIEKGADYNTKSIGGLTPLMMASSKEDEKFIIHLLNLGVNLEDADMNGKTAIFYTVNRYFKNFKILFEAGAEINRRNERGRSLLHSACLSGSIQVASFLIKLGADVNEKYGDGFTPLFDSITSNIKFSKLLLQAGAIIDNIKSAGARPGEESFDIFVQRFEAAFEANTLEEGKRMPIFVSLLDSEMLKLGNDLFFPSTMKEQPYERLIQRIKLYLAPRKKVIPQRCRFLKRIQLENESVSEYLRELRHLAMDCTFGEMLEVMLRDRFVAGIKSESLQKKLLQEDTVTLDRVFSIAVSFELAEQNAKELQDGLVAKLDIVPGGNRKNEARRGWQHGPGMQRRETICFRCGGKTLTWHLHVHIKQNLVLNARELDI